MGQDTQQIEQEIRSERRELDRNLRDLETQAKALTDWRTHYRNHTGLALGAAFAGGLAIGLLATRRAETNGFDEERFEADDDGFKPAPAKVASVAAAGARAWSALGDRPRVRQQVSNVWDDILETLIGIGTVKAVEVIGHLIPGFQDQYRTRRQSQAEY